MKRSVILLILALALPLSVSGAEVKEVYFGTAEGLSNGSVTCILQDTEQMLWIGTWDGLNMYDGHRFMTWKFDPGNPQTLSNNIIRNIVQESNGLVWIATDHGINRLDIRQGSVQRFYPGHESRMPNVEESFDVAVTQEGTVFCSSIGWGLSWYDPATGQLVSLNIPEFNTSLIKRIYTWNGVDLLLQTEDMKLFVVGFHSEGGNVIMEPARPLEHSPEALFVGQSKGGLVIVSSDYNVWCKSPESASLVYVGALDTREDVRAASMSESGKVYVALERSGVCSAQSGGGPFTKEKMAESVDILSMYCGSQDILWIGSDGKGLVECFESGLAFNKTPVEEVFPMRSSPVRAFWEDTDGTLYIGSKGSGIAKCRPNGSILWIGPEQGLSNDAVYCISEGLYPGHILIGSDGDGVDLYFPSSNRILPVKPAPGTNWRFVYALCPDPERDCVWVGTNGFGLVRIRYSLAGNKVNLLEQEIYANKKDDPYSLSNNIIFSVVPAGDGRIWVGTRGGGLDLFDPETGKSTRYVSGDCPLVNNDILTLYMDPDSTLWVGTSYGFSFLRKQDVESGHFHSFTEADGLANNTIHGILSDKDGRIWLSTTRGISMFDPSDTSFVNYFNYEELQSNEFSDGASFMGRDGSFYFGGVGGYNRFRQEDIHIRDYSPDVIFSELSVKQKPLESFDPVEGVTLRHDENFFSVRFFARDFIRGENCEYMYMLDGFEDSWNYSGTNGMASFTNVPPGKYDLLVRCTNGDKVWNDTVYSLPVRIRPHWSATPWAYLAYFLLALLLGYLALRILEGRMKQRELLLMESMKNRQQKDTYEAKLDFFTSISHEFSTPLTLIYGSGEYLHDKYSLSPDVQRHVSIIRNNAARMQRLVGDLLDFRKADTGNYVPQYSRVDLTSFISQVADNFIEAAQEDGIKFGINIPSKPVQVTTDREALEKILYNLISNALKYTPIGGFVQLDFQPGENADVIKVTNSGKGIKPEDLPKVFNRYEILGKLEKQMKKGKIRRNGIGLALSRSLARALSGDITVDSVPDKSTTFTLSLPKISADEITQEQGSAVGQSMQLHEVELPETVPEPALKAFGGESDNRPLILVVDDERQICDLLSEILTNAGWRVVAVSNGEEAVNILKNSRPDLIISDIVMPQMDGLELIKYVRNNEVTSQIPFVFLTFKDDVDFNIRGREIGADAYLQKPFHPKLLVSVVRQILSSRVSLKNYYGSVVSSADMFEGKKMDAADKAFLVNLTKIIESNLSDPEISLDDLYSKMGTSRSNMYRKLKELTGMSPSQFVNSVKVRHAAHQLRTTRKTVQEIMYESGYNYKSHFYREFYKVFGMTPKDLRASEE
jgi:signal transduction histidine kinase/DNA-binding response OmpR family regulator/sugar lactone lactonase YvrE